ncbi:major facilitator superfamily protein [Pseudomonas sp. BAY1663]|uniref:hypothetical protein n=1 Tax=Pseudomonas sp. BAY1663 TaxID=1439940 RepID=UPI00042E062B|nr:hypothetical protein [Pseudomonas sp. BAY1663]EXF47304.1 major facilitator superfamily protein [Pseudomonas sp. BAY1663]
MLIGNPVILRLFIAQALFWTCSMTGITLTALIGLQLAPVNGLATLPVALLVLGNLLAIQPLSRRMQLRGRRQGFVLGALAGVLGGLLSSAGVWLGDFLLLCLGALPLGAYQASAMFYRFAALETVGDAEKGRATACVIGGGVCAALLAPSLGAWHARHCPCLSRAPTCSWRGWPRWACWWRPRYPPAPTRPCNRQRPRFAPGSCCAGRWYARRSSPPLSATA